MTIIINYCAAIAALLERQVTIDSHPVVLCVTDNISAKNWTLHTSKKLIIGHALARFFCGLLIGSDVGINAKWINTAANKIVDKISRIKKSNTPLSFHYDFTKLQQDHTELKNCCFFQPSPELLSMIWAILLMQKIARLKQGSAVETKRFRQAQYINWCKSKLVPDPCGKECGYECIVACFIENLLLDCNSRSATAQGYVQSINKLFKLCNFPIPADFYDKKNMTAKLIHVQERKETIARRRSPITKEMFIAIANRACNLD